MKMNFQYTLSDLQIGKYKMKVNAYMKEALAQGVQTWLNAALSIIPVWSGASHGTFQKLAHKLGAEIPAIIRRDEGLGQGPEAGAAKSSAKVTIFDFAYVAEYGTDLWHLVYNEYNNANANPIEGRLFSRLKKPGPYHFQQMAGAAFMLFAKTLSLPSPWKSLKITRRMVK